MEYGFTTAAYVVAAVLFIQSLGGLSGQESAKRAVWYGIAGMALAVAATLYGPGAGNWLISLVMVAVGGAILVADADFTDVELASVTMDFANFSKARNAVIPPYKKNLR